MYTRPIKFGEATFPTNQRRLRPVKSEVGQEHWILIAARDDHFDLAVVHSLDGEGDFMVDRVMHQPYAELWNALASLNCGKRKHWCIGWRIQYALEKADFLQALEDGKVKLPSKKIKRRGKKHTGRLTYNNRIVEVDAVCGRNKIKFLDWANFGIDLSPDYPKLNVIDLPLVERMLREFLDMAYHATIAICKTTAAQLGWNHARRIAPMRNLCVNMDHATRAIERRAYHGGRNECFYLGEMPGTTYSMDVKSCYASICAQELLPCACIEEYRAGCDVAQIRDHWCDHWIADVVLKTDRPDYPLRWQGTPLYPIGEFVTSLAWPELRRAILAGHVVKILNARRYQADSVFRDYAEWYQIIRRAKGDSRLARLQGVIKSMFNSSLGYTAREKYDWVPWRCQIGHKFWLGTTVSPDDHDTCVAAQVLDGECRWLRVAGEPFEAMPMLHATICSYARVKLLDIFEAAGRENILYCDTDGILVNRQGREALDGQSGLTGNRPGQLCERFAPGRARIQGQKSYRIGQEFIQAGLSRTRYSALQEKQVLTVPTGRVDEQGRVWPFEFACEPSNKEPLSWVNVLK